MSYPRDLVNLWIMRVSCCPSDRALASTGLCRALLQGMPESGSLGTQFLSAPIKAGWRQGSLSQLQPRWWGPPTLPRISHTSFSLLLKWRDKRTPGPVLFCREGCVCLSCVRSRLSDFLRFLNESRFYFILLACSKILSCMKPRTYLDFRWLSALAVPFLCDLGRGTAW